MLMRMTDQKKKKLATTQELPAAAKRFLEENQALRGAIRNVIFNNMESNVTTRKLNSHGAAKRAEDYFNQAEKKIMGSFECSQARQDLINVKKQRLFIWPNMTRLLHVCEPTIKTSKIPCRWSM